MLPKVLSLPLLFAVFFAAAIFIFALEEQPFVNLFSASDSEYEENDMYMYAYLDEYTEEEYIFVFEPQPVRWYRSNPAGMALGWTPSRLVAQRYEYSLSVEVVPPEMIPYVIAPYHNPAHQVEVRTLFRDGEEIRHQWIFRNRAHITMLAASGNAAFFGGEGEYDENASGFIEFMNSEGSVVRERFFEDDLSQWDFHFFFDEDILLSAQTWFKRAPFPAPAAAVYEYYYYEYGFPLYLENGLTENQENYFENGNAAIAENLEPELEEDYLLGEEIYLGPPEFVLVFTDYFRYSRTGALRAIDRVFHDADGDMNRILFPRNAQVASFAREAGVAIVFYTPDFILTAMNVPYGSQVSYSLDSRGRLLREVWRDEDGRIAGEFINTWDGDRLVSVSWRTDTDERLVQYEYDNDGNRIVERNYRHGVLERIVSQQNGQDIEEIFLHGRLALRAVWEEGLLISEENIFQLGGGAR